MNLQFGKLNPDIRDVVVTSIKPSTGSLIKFYNANNPTEEATTGDLLADVSSATAVNIITTEVGEAIKTVTATAEGIVFEKGNVVTDIVPLAGITASSNSEGVVSIGSTLSGLNGFISFIEPEGTDFEMYGLNSFLTLINPATRKTGFLGKFQLPSVLPPSTDLQFKLLMIGKANATGVQKLGFDFSYATSTGTSLLSPVVTTSNFEVTLADPFAQYTSYTFTPTAMKIPAAQLLASGLVNFRLTRAVPAANAYTSDVGLLAIYWTF
jgi:hypothetical protein